MRPAWFLLFAVLLAAAGFVVLALARRGPRDSVLVALLRLVLDSYVRIWHGLRREPAAPASPIPPEGPAIVVSNHRSAIDPLALAATTRRIVQFLMAREYYQAVGFRWLFRLAGAIPVNRDGNDLGATKAALKVLREGGVIGIFPQGGIREDGELAGKAGVALLALRTGAPVIPAYITGTPSLDSVFLTMFVPSRSRIRFGEPLRFVSGAKKVTREEIDQAAERITEAIAGLRPGEK